MMSIYYIYTCVVLYVTQREREEEVPCRLPGVQRGYSDTMQAGRQAGQGRQAGRPTGIASASAIAKAFWQAGRQAGRHRRRDPQWTIRHNDTI
jgi:hypothetical protein